MLERDISKGEVEEALAHPIEIRQTRSGRAATCGSPEAGRCLIVIYEESDEGLIVVTALRVSSEKAKKYGFTAV